MEEKQQLKALQTTENKKVALLDKFSSGNPKAKVKASLAWRVLPSML